MRWLWSGMRKWAAWWRPGRWRGRRQQAAPAAPRPVVPTGTGPLAATAASEPLEVVAAVVTDVGCEREVNEDCGQFVAPEAEEARAAKGVLAVVADGMGGHSAGEVASRTAVETVSRVYYASARAAEAALGEAFEAANRAIYEAAGRDARLRGMGTTCTALVVKDRAAFAAHIGDSRLYLVRGGQIYLMSEDHSVVREMVRRGVLTPDEARRHAEKNVILRALGTQPVAQPATWDAPLAVRAEDRFVLCSDGLSDLVEDEEIRQAAVTLAPEAACARLVALAKERGGHDNITVAVVELRRASDGAASAGGAGDSPAELISVCDSRGLPGSEDLLGRQ
jgi:PPM family protein phosphatase